MNLLNCSPSVLILSIQDDLNHEQKEEQDDDLAAYALLGADPREHATPAAGEAVIGKALAEWERWLQMLLSGEGIDKLQHRNAKRLRPYEDITKEHFEVTWEGGLESWWETRQKQIK